MKNNLKLKMEMFKMKKILILVGLFALASPCFALPVSYDIVLERLPGNEEYSAESTNKSTGTIVNILIATTTATVVISTESTGWRNGPILVQNQSADDYYCGYAVNVSTYIISIAEKDRRGTVIYAGGDMVRTLTKETKYYCRSAGTTPTYIHLEKLEFRN